MARLQASGYRRRAQVWSDIDLLFRSAKGGRRALRFSAETRAELSGLPRTAIEALERAAQEYKARHAALRDIDFLQMDRARRSIQASLRTAINRIDSAPPLLRRDLALLRGFLSFHIEQVTSPRGRPTDWARHELHLDIGRALSINGVPLRKTRDGLLATALRVVVNAVEPHVVFDDAMKVCRDVADVVTKEDREFFKETGLPHPSTLR